ncbi:copper responsive regulator 1 isoform A [Chlorella sorokiniana]|uniref:Copper responsive regulator 1 isoform A n=1 Tax=Chlorella sorokiniana TaxID=3076 RepID=A0A2P6TXD8_CHLSO|nr:copper responsive regulator 1 isoform A [Chlorella sorokiniana]|eukprot:PRW58718.1 copper responsive regulator 1 isoform A [Chlorella sorokiniana]
MASFVDEAVWAAQDWKWDAQNLTATPAEAPQGGKAARKGGDTTATKQGCQVDGCTITVGNGKDYHSRYKICEFHLKAHVVQKNGLPHRFCQQCGKFQPLEDFDGDKRSCRARLDKHNARRRRQREMAHMLKKTGTIDEKVLIEKYGLSEEQLAPKLARLAKQGYTIKKSASGTAEGSEREGSVKEKATTSSATASVQAGTKEAGPTTARGASSGGVMAMSHGGTAAAAMAAAQFEADQQAQSAVLMQQLAVQQQLQEAQLAAAAMQAQAAVQAQAQAAAAAQGMLGGGHMLMGGAQAAPGPVGAAGLNLLLDDEFLDEVFNHPILEGLVPGAAQGMAGQAAADFLQLDAASAMELDDMAQLDKLTNELLGARAMGAPPAAAMLGGPGSTWPAAAAAAPMLAGMPQTYSINSTPSSSDTLTAAQQPLPPYLTAPPMQPSVAAPGFGAPLLGGTPFSGGLQPPPPLPGAMRMPGAGTRVESPASGRSTGTALPMPGMSVLDEALSLLSYDSAQVTYVPEEKLVRFSAKLFNCTPAQLPADLKASLVNMLSCQSMEGYLRPGCVHITVNALMGPEERALLAQSGVRAVVERLVARQPEAFWSQHAMLVQLGDKLVLVREGKVVHVLATAHSSLFPRVAALRPLVAEPDAEGAVTVSLWGYNLDNAEDTILARSNGVYVEVERAGLEADPAWRGMQRLDLRLTGVASAGALQLEVMRGGYISGSKAMLVTGDRLLAAEVRTLEAEESSTDLDTLLFQLAACQQFGGGAAGREYTLDDREVLGKSSRRLLAYAVQRKWVAATRTLLAAVDADQPAAEAMAAVDVMCVGITGMPLLQLAVRSQRLDLVRTLLDWGEAHGYTFAATTPGRRGLTALHLSGLVGDGGAIASLLSEKCPDALSGWEGARAEDGTLPIDFARRTGLGGVVERFIAVKKYEAAVSEGAACSKAADSKADPCESAQIVQCQDTQCLALARGKVSELRQRNGKSTDSASSSRNASKSLPDEESEGEDQVAAVKAALKATLAQERAQGTLLRFRNGELEGRYHSWYSAGQVPVDVAFLVVAALSQGAWIFRWSGDSSWLGAAMVALMAINVATMQLAALWPATYCQWREPLCVLSHIVHKLAQVAVTLAPRIGTVYSATYNPTVALLESSSLAQIAMLSFGMRLRFTTHLLVSAFHFAASAAANDQVCAAGFPFLPGGACTALMLSWQALACFAVPCTLLYASEKRSRRIFLQTVSD